MQASVCGCWASGGVPICCSSGSQDNHWAPLLRRQLVGLASTAHLVFKCTAMQHIRVWLCMPSGLATGEVAGYSRWLLSEVQARLVPPSIGTVLAPHLEQKP